MVLLAKLKHLHVNLSKKNQIIYFHHAKLHRVMNFSPIIIMIFFIS